MRKSVVNYSLIMSVKFALIFLAEDILSEKVIKIAVNFVGSPLNENFAADVNRDQFVVPLIKRSELQR